MPSRKREKLNFEAFKVGGGYSRSEIAELGGVAPLDHSREWTGIVEFENCVVLFPTLDKSDLPPEHGYLDVFDGEQFKWDSQNRNRQDSPVMVRILSGGTPVLLFCRVRTKDRGRPLPFVYVGRLHAAQARGQNPVRVLFDVLDYQQKPNPALAQLYNWRQDGSRTVDPVEVQDEISTFRIGQGRQMDSRKRHAIDEWAMLKARQYYESLGYALKDTSRNSPFDFLATSNGYQRRLEVKGLTGCVGPVIVTAGEVRAARDLTAKTDLVLVHDIVLLETAPGVFQGEGGAVHVISDWRAEDDHLKPLQYEYSV